MIKAKHSIGYRKFALPPFGGGIAANITGAFLALILALVALISIFSYRFTYDEMQGSAGEYTEQLINQVNAQINMYVGHMKDISSFVVKSAAVSSFLMADTGSQEALYSAIRQRAGQQLEIAMKTRSEISNIALFAADGRVLLGDDTDKLNPAANIKESDWYTGALSKKGEVYITSSHVQNIIDGEYRWVFSFSRAVFGIGDEPLGVLLIDLNYNIINDICARIELGNRGYIFLIDGSGDILWHPKQQLIYAGLKEENVRPMLALKNGREKLGQGDDARLYVASHSAVTGWITSGVVYMDELLQNSKEMLSIYLFVALFSTFMAVMVAIMISRAITNPIRRLANTMEAVESGNFEIRSDIVARNEVGRLSATFNHMIARMKELMNELVTNEEQKRKIEWKALQAQIKPHFLYNTLDSIIWMAHAGKNDEVVKMTVALASLLRTSIGSGQELVTLRDELDHVKSYLTIQKMRYNEKLTYTIDCGDEVAAYMLPKLILQPIVENAIYHGIKVKPEGGHISIHAIEEDERLIIAIEDTGVGMEQDVLLHVLDKRTEEDTGSGIGVSNVNERIRIHYGESFGLKYFSEPGKGTIALIVLPAHEGEER